LWKFLQKQEIIVTKSTKSVITKLQSVSKLESAEMIITKIMEAEKELVDVIPSMSFDDVLQDALFQDKMVFELE
jgi:small ligand-binding sensory domain FIST